jgi:hypothetical protein
MDREKAAARRAAVELVELSAGERVLAAAQAQTGEWLVATSARLAIVGGASGGIVREWIEVTSAKLNAATGTLTVAWADGGEPTAVRVGRGQRRLASVVNERVTASVVAVRQVATPGGTVRVALRRGRGGALTTQVVAQADVDAAEPTVAAEVEKARADLREAVGLAS